MVNCPGVIARDNKGRLKVGPQNGKVKPGWLVQKAFQKIQLEIPQWKLQCAENKNTPDARPEGHPF